MIPLDTLVTDPAVVHLLNGRLIHACERAQIITWRDLLTVTPKKLIEVPHIGRKVIDEIENIQRRFADQIPPKEHEEEEVIDPADIELARYNDLNPLQKSKFVTWATKKFELLNNRAQHVFKPFTSGEELIRVIFSEVRYTFIDRSHCGKKTQQELEAFVDELQSYYEQSIDWNDIIHNEVEYALAKAEDRIRKDFPFLTAEEAKYPVARLHEGKDMPILFVWEKYMLRTEDRTMRIKSEYLGLDPLKKSKTMEEIASEVGLSRERVRQLFISEVNLPKSFKEYLPDLRSEIGSIVSEKAPLWHNLQTKNYLLDAPRRTMRLVYTLLGDYELVHLDDDTPEYLIRKDVLGTVRLGTIRNEFNRVINLIVTHERDLSVKEVIQSVEKDIRHLNIDCLYQLFEDYVREKFALSIKNHTIHIPPNKLDVAQVVENILRQNGKAMSLDEIQERFNTMYPGGAIDSKDKLRNHFLKNRLICPKGKTGTYVLLEWDNQFTGTLIDYLIHIITTLNEPVALEDLTEFAKEQFPTTNQRSVYSLVSCDNFHRFKVLQDNYITLSSDDTCDMPVKKTEKRSSVEARFGELKEFVKTHQRFPNQSEENTEEELVLARWLKNFTSGRIDATEEEIKNVRQYIEQNKALPHTADEYRFQQNCNKIHDIVYETLFMPKRDEYPSEYQWFMKYYSKYETLTDNRRSYFEELLKFIRKFSFDF